jgi:hypothetical protein
MSETAIQHTLTGEEADRRNRPGTMLYCEECESVVLRSRRQEHEHDGVQHDALDDAKHQAHVAAATLKRLDGVEGEEEPALIGGDD